MKYILKIYRRLLRFSWFKTISFPFVQNYNLVNDNSIRQGFIKQFINEHGLQVIHGPFSGLKYPTPEAYGSALLPKLMGTYEHELHHIIDDLKKRNDYTLIIDIGAAEGYYAIGLAKIFKKAKVVAFETSAKARKLLKDMTTLNNVSTAIQIEQECGIESLKKVLNESRGLIICDCEGFELNLLDPDAIPEIKNYDIIVELHDYSFNGKTVTEIVRARFEKSHYFSFINIRRNKPIDHLKNFEKEQIIKVADENRAYSVGWAFLEAKGNCDDTW